MVCRTGSRLKYLGLQRTAYCKTSFYLVEISDENCTGLEFLFSHCPLIEMHWMEFICKPWLQRHGIDGNVKSKRHAVWPSARLSRGLEVLYGCICKTDTGTGQDPRNWGLLRAELPIGLGHTKSLKHRKNLCAINSTFSKFSIAWTYAWSSHPKLQALEKFKEIMNSYLVHMLFHPVTVWTPARI